MKIGDGEYACECRGRLLEVSSHVQKIAKQGEDILVDAQALLICACLNTKSSSACRRRFDDVPSTLCDPLVSPCRVSFRCFPSPARFCYRSTCPAAIIDNSRGLTSSQWPIKYALTAYKAEVDMRHLASRTLSFSFNCKEKLLGNILFMSGPQTGLGACCNQGC